jgi:hypothetical protein
VSNLNCEICRVQFLESDVKRDNRGVSTFSPTFPLESGLETVNLRLGVLVNINSGT